MLEQLFGSKTRTRLLKLFLDNPAKIYFVRELTREIDTQINSIRRELNNLEHLGILKIVQPVSKIDSIVSKGIKEKKYFQINQKFVFFPELKSLFSKSELLIERDLSHKLNNIGDIYLLVLTGFFTGQSDIPTDILIVGNVVRPRLKKIIESIQKDLRREVNYTVLSKKEFSYRKEIGDRFIYDILLNKNIIIFDNFKTKFNKNEQDYQSQQV